MLEIAISTITKECSIFIKYNEKEFFIKKDSVDMIEFLPMEFERIIKENNIYDNIKNIIISNGPGYYTGIRIGTAFAKGLAIHNINILKQINSLDILAYKYKKRGKIAVIFKAKKNIFHCAFFNGNKRISEDLIINEKDLQKIKKYIFIGEGIKYIELNNTDKNIIYPDAKIMYEYFRSMNE